ncbi:sigma-70 family RNA polymerase sigma factor [Balneolaceae bacterium ANBcel3]|nr:sigma-70 family RNA polymerase sigma factor [Balneolaceae bacterium ANBcel3]
MSLQNEKYSELVEAISRQNERRINELSTAMIRGGILYLKVRFGAPHFIAEECAQNAFISLYESIRAKKIKNPELVASFFKTSAKNDFLKIVNKEKRAPLLPDNYDPVTSAEDSFEILKDDERKRKLDFCIEKLSEDKKEFITTIRENSSLSHEDLAKIFGYSTAKTRTLKSRIMKELRLCISKSMK